MSAVSGSASVPLVGFTGPRDLAVRWSPLVGAVVQAVVRAGRGVAVGDAAGADAFVAVRARQCGVQPHIFHPTLYGGRRVAGALAHRSALVVAAVQQSGPGAGVVGFVAAPCPAHPRSGKLLVPSASSVQCFAGFGSGTWSTLAFAVGLRLPVVVFCAGAGFGAPVSPRAALPPHWGGIWVPASGPGPWGRGWRFVPLQHARAGVPHPQPWQR